MADPIVIGALSLGAGEAIRGRSLDEKGRAVLHVGKALDMTATAWAAGRPVPGEAVRTCAKLTFPKPLQVVIGNANWRWQAWKQGVLGHIKDQSFE